MVKLDFWSMKFKILNKVFGSGSAPARDRFAFLALVKDIDYYPPTDSLGVLLLDDIKMKENCGMMQIYLTSSSQEYSYEMVGESDSKSFKVKFTGTHPGTEQQALEFSKNFVEEEFVVLIPQCNKGIKVLGSPGSPLIFTSSHKSVKDSEKFNFVFEQEVGSEQIYMLYDGTITLNTNIDIDMKDFLELLKGYIKIDGSNLTDAQKLNLRNILGVGGGNLGNSDLSLSENRSFNLKTFFFNFFSNVGLARVGINKNNPTQALDVVGNIKTDGLIIAEGGSPEEIGSIKRIGDEIHFKTSAGWDSLLLKGDYISDSHGVIYPDTLEPVDGWKIGWYTPKISAVDPGTNYPNQGNQKSIEDYFTEFYFNGTTWETVSKKMPTSKAFIPAFADVTFPLSGDVQVTHLDRYWQLREGKIALVTDVPSDDSTIWKSIGGGSIADFFDKDNDNQALSASTVIEGSIDIVNSALVTSLTEVIGLNDLSTVTESVSIPNIHCINQKVVNNGKLSKLNVRTDGSGVLNVYRVSFQGGNPNSDVPITKVLLYTVNLTTGIKSYNVNINVTEGDYLGFSIVGSAIFYNGLGPGRYIDVSNSTVASSNWNNQGNLGVNFEIKYTENSYTIDDILNLLKNGGSSGGGSNADLNSGFSLLRVTIEGQSNALGVAYETELYLPPFENIERDWSEPFDRVYIWEPYTQEYQKLHIGVNNMASWDVRYSAGTASSFGVEVGIALNFLKNNKSGLLFIDKNVGDGKLISYFQKGGAYYAEKLSRKNKADEWLLDRGIKPREVGFVWVQGEGNMNDDQPSYFNALNTLISDRLNDGFILPSTLRVITQIGSSSSNYGAGVKLAKDAYVSTDLKAKIVTYGNNYNSDNIHLNAVGQVNLGLQSAKEILLSDNITIADL
ncbi:sialate O-acetylesterase [Chryseobacterium sp.]|uniref:sialate O-acetylesterase n=1 Tax=Chryseobacterium sp. TaxID=1871047 RepID=UPI00388D201B